MKLNLSQTDLFSRFDGSVRRAIRKAEKHNFEITTQTDISAFKEYYDLHCLTRRKHGLPPQPWLFFANFQRNVAASGMGFVVLARKESRAVAGAIFGVFNGKAIFKFGASDERFQEGRPNNLVIWKALSQLSQEGCQSVSFGRTSIHNDGLRRFKLHWGTTETPLAYSRFPAKSAAMKGADMSKGFHNFLFSSIPPALNRLCGRLLYPHLD